MRIKFLGTAASEGYPDAFCSCEHCCQARDRGGKNIRMRSAALIDNELLIDFGPDLMAASWKLEVPLYQVKYLLQTHEHGDHLDLTHFSHRSRKCAVPNPVELQWFASRSAGALAANRMQSGADLSLLSDPELIESLSFRYHPLDFWTTAEVGPYRVLPVPAVHGDGIDAMLHAIERDGKQLFYGTDTGPVPEDTWPRMANEGWQFDVVVMDHTFGIREHSRGHHNAKTFLQQAEAMRRNNLLKPDTRIIATHLAHHSNPLHEELEQIAAKDGYEIAFDGMEIDC